MPITPAHLANIASFDDLAKLFYAELGWPKEEWRQLEVVAKLYDLKPNDIPGVGFLAAVEPLTADQTWGIFLVNFGDKKMQRSALRGILSKVAERARHQHALNVWPHESILFIIQHSGNAFTLVQFRGETLANARLRQFGWADPLEARTAVDNLNRLQWGQDWADAWNVEKLTKDFFTQLSDLFFKTADALIGPIPNDNERRLFVQTLFNRLIFLRFVEKKGWLKFPSPTPVGEGSGERAPGSDVPLSYSGGRGVRGEGSGVRCSPLLLRWERG